MYQIKLTHGKNFIILIILGLISFGIGPLQPWYMLLYAIAAVYLLATRTRFIALGMIPFVIATLLFIFQFNHSIASPNSFQLGNSFVILAIIISSAFSIAYFGLNYAMLINAIPFEKKKDKKNVNEKRL